MGLNGCRHRKKGIICHNEKTVKEIAYTSLVIPKLEYIRCVWDQHTKSKIHQLGTSATDTTIPAQLLKCYKHSIGQL